MPFPLAILGVVPCSEKIDIIWNLTLVCPWDCQECCVDAVHVARKNDLIVIRSSGLTDEIIIDQKLHPGENIYEIALKERQKAGLELTLAGKLRVLDNLTGLNPRIDISGGDPLCVAENYELLRAASARFGRQQITLTATGSGLARFSVADIAPLVSELNFTYDQSSPRNSDLRPAFYAAGNLRKAREFAKAGVRTRGECPLTTENCRDDELRSIYLDLHDAGVKTMLLMRLFPVGRGHKCASATPSAVEYRRAISTARTLEAMYGEPKVRLQCALRFFDDPEIPRNPCDMIRESFGLMSDGTLLASPWAIGPRGKPIDSTWVLGNLAQTPMTELLSAPRVTSAMKRLDENFGHCKIISYLNSAQMDPVERMFDQADPLLAPGPKATVPAAAVPVLSSQGEAI